MSKYQLKTIKDGKEKILHEEDSIWEILFYIDTGEYSEEEYDLLSIWMDGKVLD